MIKEKFNIFFRVSVYLFVLYLAHTLYLSASERIILGYYPYWSKSSYPVKDIKYEALTHIVHAFIYPAQDGGNLIIPSGFIQSDLISTAHQRGVKVILGIGGWGQSDGFFPLAADAVKRKKFINDVTSLCVNYGYDGIDLDWEYPKSADRSNVTLLITELKKSLLTANANYTLSIAGPATDWNNGYNFTEIINDLDWIGIMTYDFHGSWTNHSGHNSPLYVPATEYDGSVDQSVKHYSGKGIASNKLCIGVGFYGWQFNSSSLYGSSSSASQIPYSTIYNRIVSGWKYNWDQVSYVPFLTNSSNTQLITYDDTLSIKYKCDYLKSKNLGGLIIWAIGQDKISTGQPLLESVGRNLQKSNGVSSNNNIQTDFYVYQNYPNPFNSGTFIKYYIPENNNNSYVSLKIFDVLGREISQLVNEVQPAGYHICSFNTEGNDLKNFPTGTYFYCLRINDNIKTFKMIYLK